MKIKIGKKIVNKESSCFIIAEAGVNHNGDLKLAKKMIDGAKKSGADSIKFQSFRAENLAAKYAKKSKYQETGLKESHYQLLKRLELSEKDHKELIFYCRKRKIVFLSTPYDEESADLLEKLGVPAFKVGSGELTHLPLLKHLAKKKLPMIVSTGGSYLNEVKEAVETIKKEGNNKIILLHCASLYPTPFEDVNLRTMLTLKKEFNLAVGYSDHTLGIIVPIAAVAMGAKVLEKHFTLDKNLPGPDHKASSEPKEFKEMTEAVGKTEKALGSSFKKPTKNEKEERKLGWRSIATKTDISKGTIIKKDMISFKRPGIGIKPKEIEKIIGRKAKRDIKKDVLLSWKDIK